MLLGKGSIACGGTARVGVAIFGQHLYPLERTVVTTRRGLFELGERARAEKIGPEDLFTAQLAWLLSLDHELARLWAGELLTRSIPGGVAVNVSTWPYSGPDLPDMLIAVGDQWRIICEHKLGAELGEAQVQRYLRLASDQEAATGIRHVVAVICKDHVRIPEECLADDRYLRPAHANHFQWEQFHAAIALTTPPDVGPVRFVRQDFVTYLEALSLDASPTIAGLELLFADPALPQAARQKRCFRRLWLPTRQWFERAGYRCTCNKYGQFYAHATAASAIPTSAGLSHLFARPSDVRPSFLSGAEVARPFLEVRVVVPRSREGALSALQQLGYPVTVAGVPVRCCAVATQARYRQHVFLASLTDIIGDTAVRPDAAQRLAAVVQGLHDLALTSLR